MNSEDLYIDIGNGLLYMLRGTTGIVELDPRSGTERRLDKFEVEMLFIQAWKQLQKEQLENELRMLKLSQEIVGVLGKWSKENSAVSAAVEKRKQHYNSASTNIAIAGFKRGQGIREWDFREEQQ